VVVILVPAIVEVIAGLVVMWVAIPPRGRRLLRNGAFGVRTTSTVRSAAAKAAAPFGGAGGAVMVVCGVLAISFPRHFAEMFIVAGKAAFLVLCLLAAAIGQRAYRSPRE
jgi:hypothetical protein